MGLGGAWSTPAAHLPAAGSRVPRCTTWPGCARNGHLDPSPYSEPLTSRLTRLPHAQLPHCPHRWMSRPWPTGACSWRRPTPPCWRRMSGCGSSCSRTQSAAPRCASATRGTLVGCCQPATVYQNVMLDEGTCQSWTGNSPFAVRVARPMWPLETFGTSLEWLAHM